MPQPEAQDPIEEAYNWGTAPDYSIDTGRDPSALNGINAEISRKGTFIQQDPNMGLVDWTRNVRKLQAGMGSITGSIDPDTERALRKYWQKMPPKAKAELDDLVARKKMSADQRRQIEQMYIDAQTHKELSNKYGVNFKDKQDKNYTIEDAQADLSSAPAGSKIFITQNNGRKTPKVIPPSNPGSSQPFRDYQMKNQDSYEYNPPQTNQPPEQAQEPVAPQQDSQVPLTRSAQKAEVLPNGMISVTYTSRDGSVKTRTVSRQTYDRALQAGR
jgi:hypothetical protein